MRLLRLAILIVAAHLPISCSKQSENAGRLDQEATKALARCGDGFIVWERSHEGLWQIWTKPLAGGAEEMLVPPESGHDHLCPKLSPDGKKLAYLSLKHFSAEYDDSPGTLWLMDLSTRKCDRLVEGARTYHENRAVVWFDDQRLCYVDSGGDATELDLKTLATKKLTSKSHPRGGWLVDRTRRHTTTGEPEFAPFDEATGEIRSMPRQGGCQPYFSADGRWGYWMSGAGGPLTAMFLATRQTTPILEFDDPRLPARQNYIYFPMLSDSMRLMAFAASANEHEHFTSNYDIFVMRADPETLDPIGKAVRLTANSGTDRYPDVWQKELPLGSFFVEGPTDIVIKAPEGRSLRWSVDGSAAGVGLELKHRFTNKGDHWIEGRDDKSTFTGLVHVRRAAHPYVTTARCKETSRLNLTFSEAVSLKNAKAEAEDGRPLTLGALSAGNRVCDIELPGGVKTVNLSGVEDLAQHPNVMKPERLVVPPQAWPQSRDGLVFAWDNKSTPSIGLKEAVTPTRTGKAFWNASGGLDIRGGAAEFESLGDAIGSACGKSRAVCIEAMIRPLVPPYDRELRPILSLETEAGEVRLQLCQRISTLVLRVATEAHPDVADNEHVLGRVRTGSTYHFVVSYKNGEVTTVLDGAEMSVRTLGNEGLKDTSGPLRFRIGRAKDTPEGSHWSGTIEHLAVYDRVLTTNEALCHYDLIAPVLRERAKERQRKVKAKLIEASRVPTLQEISPYREALMTSLYEVLPKDQEKDKQELPVGTRIAVTHWVWVNGERAKEVAFTPGTVLDLFVDPLSQHTEVKGLVIRNDLTPAAGVEEYLDASNW